jgi:hypothetical protein
VLPGISALLLGLAFVGQVRLENLFGGFVSVVHLAAWGVVLAACWQGPGTASASGTSVRDLPEGT